MHETGGCEIEQKDVKIFVLKQHVKGDPGPEKKISRFFT